MPKKNSLSDSADLDVVDLPRERMLQFGANNLKDYELLAILLRTGIKNKHVLQLAQEILQKYNLERFLTVTLDELMQIKGINQSKACTILAAIEFSRRILDIQEMALPLIQTSEDIVAQVTDIRNQNKEHLIGLYLNARSQLVHREILSIGILDSVMIHPREVFRPAMENLAAYVILVHNHPAGDLEPSREDLEITEQLFLASKIMGIELIDHLIVTKKGYASILDKLSIIKDFGR